MKTIEIVVGGVELTFKVEFKYDFDAGAPWDNSDCHGPVSEWTTRDKKAGEKVLNEDKFGRKRLYDFAEACRIAKRDGWDAAPYNEGQESKRQQAAKAALADYEYLRAWCNDEWEYVGVIVTLLDTEGNPTEVQDSVWGVENLNDYHHRVAERLADDLAHGLGVSWDFVEKPTPAWLNAA